MSSIIVKLGDIANQDRTIVSANSRDTGKRPYLGLEQIEAQTGRILSYQANGVEGISTTFAFDNRHILYGKLRPYLNKVALPDIEGRCSTEIIPLLPQGVDREFLALLLRKDEVVAAAMSAKTGSRMPRADMDELFKIEVTIPDSIDEQRRIATKLYAQLAAVDEVRKAVNAQAKDVQKIIPAILKSAFKDVEHAKRVRIGDAARTTSGTTPERSRKDYWEPPKYPWIKTGEVVFKPILTTEEKVSEKAFRECSLPLLPPGTVLIAMYGQGKTRGQSAVLEVEATTNQACFAILPNDAFDPEYLQFWLRHSYEALRTLSEARGGNQSNLNGSILNDFEVPLISIEQQRDIAQRVKRSLLEASGMQTALYQQACEIERLPSRLLAQTFGEIHNE